MNVTWDYTPTGTEDGFTVYRSTDNTSWADVSGLLGIAARSYQDTPPTLNVNYFYMVRTHRSSVPPNESSNSNSVSALNTPCDANLNPSEKDIIQVNGQPYDPAMAIKEGDTLTYQITIINAGPANATIHYICDNPSTNLQGIANNPITVTGAGANGNGTFPVLNDPRCTGTHGAGSIAFNVSGTKNVANNWIITLSGTFVTTSPNDPQEAVDNTGVIYYTDTILRTKTVIAPSLLVNTGAAKVPTFREVAP
jgi:uncharacterized repeat protein (TIGR01451 family)